jgi:hypothetical protein
LQGKTILGSKQLAEFQSKNFNCYTIWAFLIIQILPWLF